MCACVSESEWASHALSFPPLVVLFYSDFVLSLICLFIF